MKKQENATTSSAERRALFLRLKPKIFQAFPAHGRLETARMNFYLRCWEKLRLCVVVLNVATTQYKKKFGSSSTEWDGESRAVGGTRKTASGMSGKWKNVEKLNINKIVKILRLWKVCFTRIGFSVVYEFFLRLVFFLLFDRGILWHVKGGRKRRKKLNLEAAEKRENAQFLHNFISLLLFCSSTAEWTKKNDESTATTRTCENSQLFFFSLKYCVPQECALGRPRIVIYEAIDFLLCEFATLNILVHHC